MKRLVSTVIALLLLFPGIVTANANDKIKKKYAPSPKDMEVLSEKLIELESIELLTIDDIKGYIKQVENFAADYYHGSMSSMSKKDVAYRALNDVKKYADKTKASGSTRDMMECGILHTAVYHYKTALNSEELRAQIDLPVVDAVTHEIEAWQKLENTLCEYYAYSAFMQHQGGSLAQIGATGSTWSLAEARYNDTEMLQKAGFARRARNFPMVDDIRKKADETVKSLTATAKDLLDCDDDFKTSPYYNEVSKGLTAACENLSADMGAWINARISVVGCLEEQGIGIGETFKLLDNIIKIGSPEQ